MYYDETKLPGPPDAGLARCGFYYGTIYADRGQDLTFIYVINSERRKSVNMDTERWKMYRSVLPIRLTQSLVVEAYEPYKEYLLEYLSYQTKLIAEMKTQQTVLRVPAAVSTDATLRHLQRRGIDRSNVPRCLGGTYDVDADFSHWIRMRLSIEDVVPPPSSVRCYRPSIVPQVNQLMSLAGKGDLCPQAKKRSEDRKRKRNEGHSPGEDHNDGNGDDDDDDDNVLARERNALYARRSYHKRKLERLTLEGQRQFWEVRNERVRVQNAYLEEQLELAKRCVVERGEPPRDDDDDDGTIRDVDGGDALRGQGRDNSGTTMNDGNAQTDGIFFDLD